MLTNWKHKNRDMKQIHHTDRKKKKNIGSHTQTGTRYMDAWREVERGTNRLGFDLDNCYMEGFNITIFYLF